MTDSQFSIAQEKVREESPTKTPQQQDVASFVSDLNNTNGDYGAYYSAGYDASTKRLPTPTQQDWDYKTSDVGMNGEVLPYGAESWDAFGRPYYGEGMQGWWKGVTSRISSPYQLTADFRDINPDDKLLDQGKDLLNNIMQVGNLSDSFGVESPITPILRITKEVVGSTLSAFSAPAIWVERGIGTLAIKDETRTWDEAYQASRIAYSGIANEALIQNFIQRYKQGENPELLAMEMQNPGREFWGQIILDPLNLVTWWAKGGKAAKTGTAAIRGASMSDDIADVAKAVKLAEEGKDAIGAARASEKLFQSVIKKIDDLRAPRLKQEYKAGAIIATGRQAHFRDRTADGISGLTAALKNANYSNNGVIDVFHEMSRAASKNPEVANTAISALLNNPLSDFLLSDNGLELGIYINKIVGEGADATKFVNKLRGLQDDLPGMVKFFSGKGDDVAQELFPTIESMLKAQDEVAATLKVGNTPTAKAQKLAGMLDEIPSSVQWIAKREAGFAGKSVKGLNAFFGQVYMGASPGYAARNMFNNTFTLLIDQGPGSLVVDGKLLNRWESVQASTNKMLGFVELDSSLAASTRGIGKQTDIGGRVAGDKWFDFITKKASDNEKYTASLYINKSVRTNMKRMLPKALTPLREALEASGADQNTVRMMMQYMNDSFGDIGEATAKLRKISKGGKMSAGRDISMIPWDVRKHFEGIGKYDELLDIFMDDSLKSLDDVLGKIDNLAADHIKLGEQAFSDPHAISRGSNAVGDLADTARVFGDKSPETVSLTAGINAQAEVRGILTNLKDDILSGTDAALDAKSNFTGVSKRLGFENKPFEEIDSLISRINGEANQTHYFDNKTLEDFVDSAKIIGAQPENWSDFKSVRSAVWETLSSKARENWTSHYDEWFDNIVSGAEKSIDNVSDDVLKKSLRITLDSIPEKRDGIAKAFNGVFDEKTQILSSYSVPPHLEGADRVRNIANQFGVASASETGKPNDRQLLNILNKYGDEVADVATGTDKVLDVKNEADIIEKVTELPRSDLPEYASSRIKQEAERLVEELRGGEPGGRTAVTQLGDQKDVERFASSNVDWYRDLYKQGMGKPQVDAALKRIIQDAGKDKGIQVERVKDLIIKTFTYGDEATGIPPDLAVLKSLGAPQNVMDEALAAFNGIAGESMSMADALKASGYVEEAATATKKLTSLEGLSDEQVIEAFIKQAKAKGDDEALAIAEKMQRGLSGEKIMPVHAIDDRLPSTARAIYENTEGFQRGVDDLKKLIAGKWDEQITTFTPEIEKVLAEAPDLVGGNIATVKNAVGEIATADRDFGLLNYADKKYQDLALAKLYPYSYWYSGTYKNWLKRATTQPAVIANYARYRGHMEKIHAGMPEWFKYQVSTNDLPGIDSGDPFYFNLEATLWPLNGITGIDFNDPYKRVNGFTALLDDMGKFGPSTWTPYSIATAVGLSMQGEDEAAARWAGRLFPQTATFKSLLSLGNIRLPDTPFSTGNEFDPMVNMFSGGLDPYERRRVGRALSQMVTEGAISEEQAIDAANSQDGQVWEDAVMLSTKKRAPGQIQSFMMGVGFKSRTQSDVEIDKFYSDYYSVMGQYDNLSPEEVRTSFDTLRNKYPFMDALLISRKSGLDRDRSFAYSVLGRIPPGQSSDIATLAGVPADMLGKFYDDKGRIDQWAKGDQERFMTAIMDISAVLAIPDEAVAQDWTRARNAYGELKTRGNEIFGEDIQDKVSIYYSFPTETQSQRNQREAWLKQNGDVGFFLDWQTKNITTDPNLNAYYGGLHSVEGYLRRQMNADIEQRAGEDIFFVMDQYYTILSSKERSAFKKEHPGIETYFDVKDEWKQIENDAMARVGAMLREAPEIKLRDPQSGETFGQEDIRFGLQAQPQINWQEVLMPEAYNMVTDYWAEGGEIDYYLEQYLDYAARDNGASGAEDIIQQIGSGIIR